jgi:hypothetical protein
MSLLLLASMSHASEAPFQAGRFLSGEQEVYAGLFLDDVKIDTLTLGSATFRASMEELVEPMSVRIAVDRDGDGTFEVLSDEQLRAGNAHAGLAVALGLNPEKFPTALEAMQGLSLGHMIWTDGSAAVQIDVLLISALYDDAPSEDDAVPELIVLGSMSTHGVRAAAIIGGNVDEPILAAEPKTFSPDAFAAGTTSIDIVLHNDEKPNAVAMVGLDLSGDLAVQEGVRALGYRIIIDAGSPAMLNILGSGTDLQRTLAQDLPIVPDIEDFLLGELGVGFGAGAGVFRVPGVSETSQYLARVNLDFQGSPGDSSGGSGGAPPPPNPPDEPEIPAPATLPALVLLFAPARRRRS